MSTQDQHIILDKELRRDIDAIIQRIKVDSDDLPKGSIPPDGSRFRRSRERSLAITKLQEAVMWLGMDLKAINDENQPALDAIEVKAKAIYEEKYSADPSGKVWPWTDGGNSDMQQQARFEAREKLSVLPNPYPYPNSKDPSNTKIDATADGLKL